MKKNTNILLVVLGLLLGWLLADRYHNRPKPPRKSRSLEELAPILKTQHYDVVNFGSDEQYVEYLRRMVDQLVQEGLTEKEAHLVAEEIKDHFWNLVHFEDHMKTQKYLDRKRRTPTGLNEDYEDYDDEGSKES